MSGLAYGLVFLLAIYGGFFSGGYVTMLMAVFVVLSRMTFLEAIATTKAINFVSSGVATLIFLARGTVNVKLASFLGLRCSLAHCWVGAGRSDGMPDGSGGCSLRAVLVLAVVVLIKAV